MKQIRLNLQKGFSLPEILIYIAILVFLLSSVMTILFSIAKSQRAFNASKSVEGSALLAMERVTREVRFAQSVDTASSTLGVNPSVLVLDGTDINGDPRSIRFSISNGALILEENGINQGGLTKEDSRVTNLVFTLIISTSSRAIKTDITIESGTSTSYRSGNFYSTTILRGSL